MAGSVTASRRRAGGSPSRAALGWVQQPATVSGSCRHAGQLGRCHRRPAGAVVTRQNLPVLTPNLTRDIRGQFRQLHGELIAGPHVITMGGMPSLRFAGTAKFHGAAQKATLFVAFNGGTGFSIACWSTPAKTRAGQQACPEVVRTLKVSNLFTAGTTLVYRGHGVWFDYPPTWAEGSLSPQAGCRTCQWGASVRLDAVNAVDVTAHRENARVTRQNLPQVKPYVTRAERRVFGDFGGRLLAGPQAMTVGGMPGLRYRGRDSPR